MANEIKTGTDPLIDSIQWKLSLVPKTPYDEESCTIYQIIPFIRRVTVHVFDPGIISIGPFHHNKEQLLPMETVKWFYMQRLLDHIPEISLNKLVDVVRPQAPREWKIYSGKFLLDNNDFLIMLLVDNYFINRGIGSG